MVLGFVDLFSVVVLDDKGLKVTAFRVNHAPVEPAVGYRFDYKGRSIVISGDTAESSALVAAAKGADILLHEALQPKLVKLLELQFEGRQHPQLPHVFRDILTYHTTPEQAAGQAKAAGVKQLVFNHIVPPIPDSMVMAASKPMALARETSMMRLRSPKGLEVSHQNSD